MKALGPIRDPLRVQAAREVQPVQPARRQVLDRLVALAAELADAPAALITLVEDHRQVFAAYYGLPEDLGERGETPIEYSICQYAVASGKPLIAEDLAGDPGFRSHPAVEELGVAAYAGIPILGRSGHAIGTICVIDFLSREWSDDSLARLAVLADVVTDELALQVHERMETFRQVWRAIPERPCW